MAAWFVELNSNKISGWGSLTEVPSPYTPGVDGFLKVRFQLSSSLTGTAYVRDNVSGTIFSGPLANGSVLMADIPVIHGRTYTLQSSQSGTDMTARFMPLQV